MEANIIAVKELIKQRFRNNQVFFAETIKVNPHYLNRILNGNEKASSPKVCNNIINYCKENNLNYKEFIIL